MPGPDRPPGENSTELLLDLAAAMHAAAIPADAIEQRLGGVARALGIDAQFFTLQSFFATELRRGGSERVEIRRIPFDTHWDLTETRDLDALARALAGQQLDVAAGRAQLDRVVSRKSAYPRVLVALAWAVYGGATAIRVGGRWLEGLAGALIGLMAGAVHILAGESKAVNLEKTFAGAFLGTLTAMALAFVLPRFDYPIALFGGITLLVPAMVITIGIHEIANEQLEAGSARLLYGFTCFALLGAGVTAALGIGSLFGVQPPERIADKLPLLVSEGAVAVGGLALVVCLEGRARDVVWIVLAAMIAFGAQELTRHRFGERGAPVVASFVLGIAAYLYARRPGRVAVTMLVPGLLQLAPGFLGTKATFQMLTAGDRFSGDRFFDVFLVAVQMGLGILAASLVAKRRATRRRDRQKDLYSRRPAPRAS